MSIVLDKLTKSFGTQSIVKEVSLEIADGELFVLLGASGSGKSTILRLIAGLTRSDGGRILLRGRDVTHLPPQARGTGFVFQNYSLFRHMTIAENIEFGLSIRKVSRADRQRRCEELLDLVGLAGLGGRYAHQISGGQQQRVALARALAYEPAVLLLDEPLAALDVKIRVQLRRGLKEIQRRLSVTTLLVTHDQEEAYELADRIGVIDRGVLLEVGPPEQLYAQPKTFYVASFLGAGTVLAGRVVGQKAKFGPLLLPLPGEAGREEGSSVELVFRPEQVALSTEEPASSAFVLGKGPVVEQTFAGAVRRLRLRLPRLPGTRQVSPTTSFGEEGMVVEALVPANFIALKQELWVQLREWTILEQAPPRVLVIDTGSGPTSALEMARALGEPMQASVTAMGMANASDVEALRPVLRQRVAEVGLKDAEIQISAGDLTQQVAAQCARAFYELLIVSARRGEAKADVDRDVLGLLERADIPVLVVTGQAKGSLSRVLICTRAGEPGKNDIRFGGRLTRFLNARVTLLHVTADAVGVNRITQRHLREAAATLTALEVPNEVRIRPNPDAADAIVEESAAQDLLVMGGHGPESRSFFRRGDVTLQVLNRAHCPVLVVPWAAS